MDQYLNTAYDVTTQLFGPESGIPWWAWLFVIVALFWKVAVPEPRAATDERDSIMLSELLGESGAKGKKKK
jgi:hypothetical protein